MHALYAFGLLMLIAFLGSPYLFRRKKKLSSLHYFFSSGLIYIFLGLFLGNSGLGVINSSVLRGLLPLLSFGLGWIGFLFGFQLEKKYLKRFPRKYIGFSFFLGVFIFSLTFCALFLLLRNIYRGESLFLIIGMSVALGALWTNSSPSLIHVASSAMPNKGNYYYIARFIASISGFWAILGIAVLSSFWHYPFFPEGIFWKGGGLLVASTLFSLSMGLLFHWLTKKRVSGKDLLVYLLGFVFFVSGTAFSFNFSPLYVGMILGLTYSNLTRMHEKIYPLLLSTEKALYVIFLVLIGALWQIQLNATVMGMVLFLVLTRTAGLTLPMPFLRRVYHFSLPLPMKYGLSFMATGGIGVAFAVSIKLHFPLALTDTFLSAALISIIFVELISPFALRKSLVKLDKEG